MSYISHVSWQEQATFNELYFTCIMARTSYIRWTIFHMYHGKNKLHSMNYISHVSWQEQATFNELYFTCIMARTNYIQWDDSDVHLVLDQHT
jgi:hypothetical protein